VIGWSAIAAIKCGNKLPHRARLLIQIRDQAAAINCLADFPQIAAIDTVHLKARETANFDAVVGEERISQAVPEADAVPGRRANQVLVLANLL
jgi:hypothetical protein